MKKLTPIENNRSYPVPFIMREQADWWFRIHSLPDSKRYPETNEEWEILLLRHREISNSILLNGSVCRLTYAQFSGFDFPKAELPHLKWQFYKKIGDNEDSLDTWISDETIWDFQISEAWIRKRSNDELGMIGFHSTESNSIYFPYNGGADIFSLNETLLSNIQKRFSKWRSPLESGL